MADSQFTKRCPHCKEIKAAPEFRKRSDRKSGLQSRCRECQSAHDRERQRSAEYRIWIGIKTRCNNHNDHAYRTYGAVGIKLCERWAEFSKFLEDMGVQPSPSHSIDRVDNGKGYEPGNCRWATRSEQQRNRRDSTMLTFRGETMNLHDWAEKIGIAFTTIKRRLQAGWTVEESLTTPVSYYNDIIAIRRQQETK